MVMPIGFLQHLGDSYYSLDASVPVIFIDENYRLQVQCMKDF